MIYENILPICLLFLLKLYKAYAFKTCLFVMYSIL